jgi:CheY-like chemotaxis protein
MRLDSEWGVGTTIEVTLPVASVKRSPVDPASGANGLFSSEQRGPSLQSLQWISRASKVAGSLRASGGADVLVVEDNFVQQKLYKHRAVKAGLRMVVASSGAEALSLVRSGKKFGLALLDLQMEPMAGDEVCRRLRQDGYDGVVVCVTGTEFTAVDRAEFIRKHGFDDLVHKGASPSCFDVLVELGRLRAAAAAALS